MNFEGTWQQAIDACTAVLERTGDSAKARYRRAQACRKLGQLLEARLDLVVAAALIAPHKLRMATAAVTSAATVAVPRTLCLGTAARCSPRLASIIATALAVPRPLRLPTATVATRFFIRHAASPAQCPLRPQSRQGDCGFSWVSRLRRSSTDNPEGRTGYRPFPPSPLPLPLSLCAANAVLT